MRLAGGVSRGWRVVRILLLALFLLLMALVGFLIWAAGGESSAEQAPWLVLEAEDGNQDEVAPMELPDRLTVLTWNIAYGRGPVDDKGDLRDRDAVVG